MRLVTFEIPGRPPTPNESNRTQASAYRWRLRREWRATAGSFASAAKLGWERTHGLPWLPLRLATMRVTFILPTKRRYDLDNLLATLKPELDGIVDSGLLVDDSIYVLPHFYVATEYRKGVTSTVFDIAEIAT